MADIKVCDRCGKRLTEERSIFSVTPSRCLLNVTLVKKATYSWEKSPKIVNTIHDLCVDCTGELAKWLAYESSMEETK